MQLSKKKLDGLKVWDDIEPHGREQGPLLKALSPKKTRAALVANVKGIRVFIPASQSGIAKGGDMSASGAARPCS